MSNEPLFPQASAPDTVVRGRLVPPALAHQARLGQRAGILYLVLKVAFLSLFLNELADQPLFTVLCAFEIACIGAAVHGTCRWNTVAAWSLFALLVVSAFAGVWKGSPVPEYAGSGALRVAFLSGFGLIFGRAAMAIRAFNRIAQGPVRRP